MNCGNESANSGHRSRAWQTISTIARALPKIYFTTNHTMLLDRYVKDRHPHVALKRWIIGLPNGGPTCRIFCRWAYRMDSGMIQVASPIGSTFIIDFGSAFLYKHDWDGAVWDTSVWPSNNYDAGMRIVDDFFMRMMHRDALLMMQSFFPTSDRNLFGSPRRQIQPLLYRHSY